MSSIQIQDETEVTKVIVVNQRSYCVPADVADERDEFIRVLMLVHRGLQSGNVKSKPLMGFSNPNAESLKLETMQEIIERALISAPVFATPAIKE